MIRGRGWIAALTGLLAAMAAASVALFAVGAGLMAEAEAYFAQYDFSTAGPVEVDQEEFDAYNNLYLIANDLGAVAVPLLFCSLSGAFVLLAVLSQRYDVSRGAKRTAQIGASAAS